MSGSPISSAVGHATKVAFLWVALATIYIAAAKPFGRHISTSEWNSIWVWLLGPAAVIFVVVFLARHRWAVPAVSRSAVVAFNSWSKEKQRRELKEFVESLSAMDGSELGLAVALAGNFKNRMLLQGADLNEPALTLTVYPEFIFELSKQVAPLQNEGKTLAALPLLIWVHSLRAISRPELRQLGRDMWGQLERGFKHAENAADAYQQMTGEVLEISGAAEFPNGLTPKPLD